MTQVYCAECGFQNPETANFCARCGAMLPRAEPASEATQSLTPEDVAELTEHHELGLEGPALVVRAGGGRTGESFSPQGDRTTIGRSPDCGVFLDEVTVSRRHATLVNADGQWRIEDLGSLNGTFVNRRRVETAELEDGDEIQIGKYRLTFLRH